MFHPLRTALQTLVAIGFSTALLTGCSQSPAPQQESSVTSGEEASGADISVSAPGFQLDINGKDTSGTNEVDVSVTEGNASADVDLKD